MSAAGTETLKTIDHKPHAAFFRQSGWMMMAGVGSGAFMYMVHPIVARELPKGEYGVFTTLLQVVAMMGIPAVGLQQVVAQQAAAAITLDQQRTMASEFRGIFRGIFFIWLAMAFLVGIFWHQALAGLKIENSAALGVTVVIGLVSMWSPLVGGMLQGRQNFFWLGWTNIFNGLGRFGLICLIVLALHGWAAGAMAAVLLGITACLVTGLWQIRDVWKMAAARVEWMNWLGRVVPLTLGLGAAMFMLSADMIFTQKYFPREQTGLYAAAAMIGRALIFFTQPLTLVMFPKLARSAATGEKSNALLLAMGATILAGSVAAIGCTLFPWLPLLIVGGQSFLVVAPLVPWFAWCMLPLTLSNVLINSLMARSRFAAVPWLVLVAVAYGVALAMVGRHAGNLPDSQIQAGLRMMVQTLGIFNLILLGVCAWFTWGVKAKAKMADGK